MIKSHSRTSNFIGSDVYKIQWPKRKAEEDQVEVLIMSRQTWPVAFCGYSSSNLLERPPLRSHDKVNQYDEPSIYLNWTVENRLTRLWRRNGPRECGLSRLSAARLRDVQIREDRYAPLHVRIAGDSGQPAFPLAGCAPLDFAEESWSGVDEGNLFGGLLPRRRHFVLDFILWSLFLLSMQIYGDWLRMRDWQGLAPASSMTNLCAYTIKLASRCHRYLEAALLRILENVPLRSGSDMRRE